MLHLPPRGAAPGPGIEVIFLGCCWKCKDNLRKQQSLLMSFFFFSLFVSRNLISLLLLVIFFAPPRFKDRRQHFWDQAGRFLLQRRVYSAQGKGSPEHSAPKWERCRWCGSSCPASIPFFSHFFPTFLLFKPFSSRVSTERIEFLALTTRATGMGWLARPVDTAGKNVQPTALHSADI